MRYVYKAPEARSQKSWVIGIDEGTLESIQIFKVSEEGHLRLSREWHIIQLHEAHKFNKKIFFSSSFFHHPKNRYVDKIE